MKTKDHNPNKKQIELFNNVIQAINKAKAGGLVFYGKQFNLVAYTKEADNYTGQFDFEKAMRGAGSHVAYISAMNILHDSGADDYAHYATIEDAKKYDKNSYYNK